jgi:hypothetical protein
MNRARKTPPSEERDLRCPRSSVYTLVQALATMAPPAATLGPRRKDAIFASLEPRQNNWRSVKTFYREHLTRTLGGHMLVYGPSRGSPCGHLMHLPKPLSRGIFSFNTFENLSLVAYF